MTSLIFSQIGSAIGKAAGGTVGSVLGQAFGALLGSQLDNRIFPTASGPIYSGARLSELVVQTSTYGKMVPSIYGTVRIAGNII
jgi:hypothetical protein